jgi:Fe-S-cluster containining protein
MHPCRTCGACCAMWAVQFHNDHLQPRGPTPRNKTVPAKTKNHSCMIGTNQDEPRCIALEGVIGDRVRCSIYPDRPPVCHDVIASYEHGHRDRSCDDARARHGLPRITVRDW